MNTDSYARPTPPFRVPEDAEHRDRTPYDYIIIGAGAGGAPLACRLAQAGMKVLILEAGGDPGAPSDEATRAEENAHPIYYCPGFHAAASEPHVHGATGPEATSLSFQVDQYEPSPRSDAAANLPKRLYPRAAALGGCSAHHSMIAVYGLDSDWQQMVDLTNDPSWSPSRMRAIYQCIERAHYNTMSTALTRWWSRVLDWTFPRRDAVGQRGETGWLDVTTSNPEVLLKDSQLAAVVQDAAFAEQPWSLGLAVRWVKRLLMGRFYSDFDLNDAERMRFNPEGIALVPLGVTERGVRKGPREFILRTQAELAEKRAKLDSKNAHCSAMAKWPRNKRKVPQQGLEEKPEPVIGELAVATCVLVHKLLFVKGAPVPQAVGVLFEEGEHLFAVSEPRNMPNGEPTLRKCFARREIILCGGAFHSPQLLMLSGIGERAQLRTGLTFVDDHGANLDGQAPIFVNLPGVGKNLRDRSEIGVICEMKGDFASLKGVTFSPNLNSSAADDEALSAWKKDRQGIYTTNGAALSILRRSSPSVIRPDLLLLGFPGYFQGYHPGWSKDLLGCQGNESKRHWTWVILKAFSGNTGEVRLVSSDVRVAPAINFHRFGDHLGTDGKWHINPHDEDLDALCAGVAYARSLNDRMDHLMAGDSAGSAELEPSRARTNDSPELRDWLVRTSWGHHASGTCRIGRDTWQASTDALHDVGAVCDSAFRVHGVRGLRVVDASVFPEIPGYFIVVPVYMVSEKAADTLLNETPGYPTELKAREAAAVALRRQRARVANTAKPMDLPADTLALAFSGGGIRSASFCLGVLQSLASAGRLREIDFLSTCSGGGYTGSFLGRLFTRPEFSNQTDPVRSVEKILTDNTSSQISWLRQNSDYINARGEADLWANIATYWRNLLTIAFVLGTFGITLFSILKIAGDCLQAWGFQSPHLPQALSGLLPAGAVSLWWWVPLALFLFGVLPLSLGYWLAPKARSSAQFSFYPLLAWVTIVAGLSLGLGITTTLPQIYAAALISFLLVGGFLELMRQRMPVSPDASTGESAPDAGTVIRNRSDHWLSVTLQIFILACVAVVIDSLARALASGQLRGLIPIWGALLTPLLPFLRQWVQLINPAKAPSASEISEPPALSIKAALIAFPVLTFLLVCLDAFVHWIFAWELNYAWPVFNISLALSLIFGRAFDFLNFSSLHGTYAARLVRTFLGASNAARFRSSNEPGARDVQQTHPDDDIAFDQYEPESNGGPIHLIELCVNETVDAISQLTERERKGLPMCVSSCGVSVGSRYHSVWTQSGDNFSWKLRLQHWLDGTKLGATALRAIRVPGEEFHVLRGKTAAPVQVETASLGTWVAASGAAVSTGMGRATSFATSLLCGLANIRLGYWWNSGLSASERPGRYRASILDRILSFPLTFFPMQFLLLAEFTGRFYGPSARFWNISDGGHFDVTALFELLRRRLPRIIAVDASEDTKLHLDALGELLSEASTDFATKFEIVPPAAIPAGVLPAWLKLSAVGTTRDEVGKLNGRHAVVAKVTYLDAAGGVSWIVYIKACVTGDEPLDLQAYRDKHPSFPSQPTSEQFFGERQFESYRRLGEHIGQQLW